MVDHYDVAVPGGSAAPLPMGERRLLLATLQDALRTLLGIRYGSRHAKCQREDLDWLMSDDEGDPFTYVRICAALGIDAGWLRGRVLAVRSETPNARPPLVATHEAEPWAEPLRVRGGGR